MSFGERLKEVRLNRGMSVSGLANAADIDRSTIHNLENKTQYSPNTTTLVLICEALEVSADYLLGLRGE